MIKFNPFTGTLDFVGNGSYIPFDPANPGAIGSTTPGSGSFTDLSVSNTVSGNGFINLFASPPPIGVTTPAAGSFTTISATGQASFTKDSSTGALNISPTWNSGATNFNAIYCRVTNTASGASSNLIDLGTVSSGSVFKVDKSGFIYLGDSVPTIARRADINMLMLHVATAGGVGIVGIGSTGYNSGINLSSSVGLAWTNDTPASTRDIIFTRASAGVLSLSAGTLLLPGASATGAINISPVWNNGATNFAAIYGRITNTSSGSSSNLIDLGTVAAGSLFSVDKNGYAKAIQFVVNGTTSSLDANCRVAGSITTEAGYLAFNLAQTVRIQRGAGSPEGVITASVGSLYLRTDGGASSTLYVKESGTGNTGWVAK